MVEESPGFKKEDEGAAIGSGVKLFSDNVFDEANGEFIIIKINIINFLFLLVYTLLFEC